MTTELNKDIQEHYTKSDLGEMILAELEKAGKDVSRLAPEDLASIDEIHIRGRAATLDLAQSAGIDSTKHVLDIGSGIGGSSRCLAREFGCHVTGIDLTDEYCRVAAMLTERMGLSALVNYRQGDALNLPFPDQTFDVVWTEHVAMNISDKPRFYSEMYRVLKLGGTLALYDVLAGSSDPVLFPVPWARLPETSFVVKPGELQKIINQAGFRVVDWRDTTDAARKVFFSVTEKINKKGLPPLGLHVLFGSDSRDMAQNVRRNLEEGRIVLAQIVAKK
jgi:MPBQ/MSBQ methyltransferase